MKPLLKTIVVGIVPAIAISGMMVQTFAKIALPPATRPTTGPATQPVPPQPPVDISGMRG